MSALLALADRVESANVDAQREMLLAAYEVIFGHDPTWDEWYADAEAKHRGKWFVKQMDAEAYLDAALSLLNNQAVVVSLSDIGGDGLPLAVLGGGPDMSSKFLAVASTMPLALTAAALRAWAAEDQHHG